jgi:endonuclease/exonuclease/phosphatase family metal-dependent hydrolase
LNRLLFLVAALTLSTASLHAADPLKVVSWNLEWFPGHRPTASADEADKHMKDAREALVTINPDVFIAIEVRDWAAFEELVSAVPGLTTHVVSSFVDPESGEIRPQQIGIASKLTCRAATWETWKANVPNISRGFSFAALEAKNGNLLMIYGNHLKSNRGDPADVAAMRNDQAKQIIAQRGVVEKAFVGKKIGGWIAAGDFNTNHDGQFPLCKVVEEMTAAGFRNTWADTPQKDRLTWSSRYKSEFQPTTFDYIFTLGLGDLNATMLDSPLAVSDHKAIQITLPLD